MPHLDDLMDTDLLADMLAQGFIRERRHPLLPLRILGYTEKAQYERAWNAATTQCRGLVVDDNGTVIARPLRKFFGDSEHDGERLPALDLSAPAEVTDKLDGSLGIGVPIPGGLMIATRGSFESEQAKWACAHYTRHYAQLFAPEPGITYLWEIIYAANRIVVAYDFEDIVLLGAVRIADGTVIPAAAVDWPGRKVRQFPYRTLADALAAPVRDNAEGFVVRYLDGSNLMTKVKLDRYVELHRIVTGLSEKTVWEHASAGKPFDALLTDLPDEFHEWVTTAWDDLQQRRTAVEVDATALHRELVDSLPKGYSRKEFASGVRQYPDKETRSYLFLLEDANHDKLNAAIWRAVKPSGDTSMVSQEEAA